jgi:hypothetical protein
MGVKKKKTKKSKNSIAKVAFDTIAYDRFCEFADQIKKAREDIIKTQQELERSIFEDLVRAKARASVKEWLDE